MLKSTSGAAEAHSYRLTLVSFPPARKVAVVKAIRNLTGLDLADAKRLAESAPVVFAATVVGINSRRSKALYALDMTGAVVRVEQL